MNSPYYQPPETPVDYHALHLCKGCGSIHQLATAKREGWYWVVTRCRCGVYSTEAGPFLDELQAARECRRMLAGLPPESVEPDGEDTRCIKWDTERRNWHIQVKVKGQNRCRRAPNFVQALRLRDELEAEREMAAEAA